MRRLTGVAQDAPGQVKVAALPGSRANRLDGAARDCGTTRTYRRALRGPTIGHRLRARRGERVGRLHGFGPARPAGGAGRSAGAVADHLRCARRRRRWPRLGRATVIRAARHFVRGPSPGVRRQPRPTRARTGLLDAPGPTPRPGPQGTGLGPSAECLRAHGARAERRLGFVRRPRIDLHIHRAFAPGRGGPVAVGLGERRGRRQPPDRV